jgi:hypothetical protein
MDRCQVGRPRAADEGGASVAPDEVFEKRSVEAEALGETDS